MRFLEKWRCSYGHQTGHNLKIAFSVFKRESRHFSSWSALSPKAFASDDGFRILTRAIESMIFPRILVKSREERLFYWMSITLKRQGKVSIEAWLRVLSLSPVANKLLFSFSKSYGVLSFESFQRDVRPLNCKLIN